MFIRLPTSTGREICCWQLAKMFQSAFHHCSAQIPERILFWQTACQLISSRLSKMTWFGCNGFPKNQAKHSKTFNWAETFALLGGWVFRPWKHKHSLALFSKSFVCSQKSHLDGPNRAITIRTRTGDDLEVGKKKKKANRGLAYQQHPVPEFLSFCWVLCAWKSPTHNNQRFLGFILILEREKGGLDPKWKWVTSFAE